MKSAVRVFAAALLAAWLVPVAAQSLDEPLILVATPGAVARAMGIKKDLAIAIALVAFAGCAQLKETFNQPSAAGGASALTDSGHPDWLRDPARGDFLHSPKGS